MRRELQNLEIVSFHKVIWELFGTDFNNSADNLRRIETPKAQREEEEGK